MELGGYINYNKVNKKQKLIIFLCCYDDITYELAQKYETKYSFFKPHLLKQTKYFESELLFYLYENQDLINDYEYVGMMAATFEKKIAFFDFLKLVENAKEGDDIFGFFTKFEGLQKISLFHKNFYQIVEKTLIHLKIDEKINDLEFMKNPIYNIFFNYWIMKNDLLKKYLDITYKIRNIWINDLSIDNLLNEDATYKIGKIPSDVLLKKFGFPYYTHHPFIYERFIGIFALLNKWNIIKPDPFHPKLQLHRNSILIKYPISFINAKYGINYLTINVENILNELIKLKVKEFQVSNYIFTDPIYGMEKILSFTYINKEKEEYNLQINEGYWLYILYN
jgi:hypothetical protein